MASTFLDRFGPCRSEPHPTATDVSLIGNTGAADDSCAPEPTIAARTTACGANDPSVPRGHRSVRYRRRSASSFLCRRVQREKIKPPKRAKPRANPIPSVGSERIAPSKNRTALAETGHVRFDDCADAQSKGTASRLPWPTRAASLNGRQDRYWAFPPCGGAPSELTACAVTDGPAAAA